MMYKDRGRILFVFISMCVVGINPTTPNWSSMVVDAIKWGGIGIPQSPFYISVTTPSKIWLYVQFEHMG